MGNPEWAWDRVRPAFERVAVPVAREPAAGGGLEAAFQHACAALGLPAVADFNAAPACGVGPVPTSTAGGRRVSTATAYLDAARGRPNLSVRPNSPVTANPARAYSGPLVARSSVAEVLAISTTSAVSAGAGCRAT